MCQACAQEQTCTLDQQSGRGDAEHFEFHSSCPEHEDTSMWLTTGHPTAIHEHEKDGHVLSRDNRGKENKKEREKERGRECDRGREKRIEGESVIEGFLWLLWALKGDE